MPDSGYDLGVDLYELWKSGHDNLPWLAWVVATANNDLAATATAAGSAFIRPLEFGTELYGNAYWPWRGLRDELQRILGDTATNLELVGDALCMAAQQYADSDSAAADELNRLKTTDQDNPPASIPTPEYPSPSTATPSSTSTRASSAASRTGPGPPPGPSTRTSWTTS